MTGVLCLQKGLFDIIWAPQHCSNVRQKRSKGQGLPRFVSPLVTWRTRLWLCRRCPCCRSWLGWGRGDDLNGAQCLQGEPAPVITLDEFSNFWPAVFKTCLAQSEFPTSPETLLSQASQHRSLDPRSDLLSPPWGGRGQPAWAPQLVLRCPPGGGPPASQGSRGAWHCSTPCSPIRVSRSSHPWCSQLAAPPHWKQGILWWRGKKRNHVLTSKHHLMPAWRLPPCQESCGWLVQMNLMGYSPGMKPAFWGLVFHRRAAAAPSLSFQIIFFGIWVVAILLYPWEKDITCNYELEKGCAATDICNGVI